MHVFYSCILSYSMEYFCKISFKKGKVRRQALGLIVLGYGCGSIFYSLILIAPFGSNLEWTGHEPSPFAIVSHSGNDGFLATKWYIEEKMPLSTADLFFR